MSRLQLSPSAASEIAKEVGPIAGIPLKDAVLRTLQVFKAKLDPFTRKDLTCVLEMAGYTGDFGADRAAWDLISAEIQRNSSKDVAAGRGFYTQKGLPAMAPSETYVPHTEPEDSTPTTEVEVKSVEGVFWSPSEAGSAAPEYASDVGLRRIAVSQSSCFGNFSPRAVPCSACPLSSFCSAASVSPLATLARDLDLATEKGIQAAIEEARKPVAPAVTPTVAPAVTPTASPSSPVDLSRYPEGTSLIENLMFEGVCTKCSDPILAGTPGLHIPAKGLFHIGCSLEFRS